MNIKEAEDFLRLKIVPPKWDEEKYKGLKRVIELLQRGEKYEAMWEELFMEKGMLLILQDDGYSKLLYKILEDLEQKYFPKKIIEEVVKGITEQIKGSVEMSKKEAKTDEDKMD
uniref:Uncharacterized protein n=1 Tax=viral metagenome TaxID=1070528 RepID=A0A6H1ZYN2_9ZZZZ